MARRAKDWLKQAERDLEHAKKDLIGEYYEWSCFSAQQAAEKALKAVYQDTNRVAWGHSVRGLLVNLKDSFEISSALMEAAKVLDKFYIPTRYPNGFDVGAPTDYFTEREAKEAIEYASEIIGFCKDILSRSR